MTPVLVAGAVYVALHLATFVAVLRFRPAFGSERTIFLYHFYSWSLVALIGAIQYLWGASSLVDSIGVFALHSVYSISFLELWSLSEGGYSLAILRQLSGRNDEEAFTRMMADLGRRKVQMRIASLVRLKVVSIAGDRVELTAAGRLVAWCQSILLAVTNSNVRE